MADLNASLSDLATVLGVNIRTVQRLTQEGVLQAEPDPSDRRRKVYDLVQVVPAYINHQVEKTTGRERAARMAELEERKLEIEVGLKESQRDLHQLKTEIASGKYLSVEQVQLDYEQFFVALKKFLMAIPARVSGRAAPFADATAVRSLERDLNEDITTLLRTFVVAGQEVPS